MKVPAAFYRGGTSKGLIFQAKDLCAFPPTTQEKIILRAIDGRQIDGLGGGISSLSKVAVIGRPLKEEGFSPESFTAGWPIDVVYKFGQVEVRKPKVDWSTTCGNLIAAVAQSAITDGIIPHQTILSRALRNLTSQKKNISSTKTSLVSISIYALNTHQKILAHVPVEILRSIQQNGDNARDFKVQVMETGDDKISGVPGTAAGIEVEFLDPVGVVGTVDVECHGKKIHVSVMDCGLPVVFASRESLGMSHETFSLPPSQLDQDTDMMSLIESIRANAGKALSLNVTPSTPKICLISTPTSPYTTSSNGKILPGEADVFVRAEVTDRGILEPYSGQRLTLNRVGFRIKRDTGVGDRDSLRQNHRSSGCSQFHDEEQFRTHRNARLKFRRMRHKLGASSKVGAETFSDLLLMRLTQLESSKNGKSDHAIPTGALTSFISIFYVLAFSSGVMASTNIVPNAPAEVARSERILEQRQDQASTSQNPSAASTSPSLTSSRSSIPTQAPQRPLARNEPADGSLYLSVFLDTSKDTPSSYARRTGNVPSSYHFTQTLPITDLPPIQLVDQTGTDAAIYLTLNPILPLGSITDLHLSAALLTCIYINRHGRRVFLRLAPSMNTPFVPYGQQPVAFKSLWSRLARAIRSPMAFFKGLNARDMDLERLVGGDPTGLLSNMTAMVWSPQVGMGYPWPNQTFSATAGSVSREDWDQLDTNRDGRLNADDDPYAPYFPGDDVVDWVGLSIYHYPNSTDIPEYLNIIPQLGRFESILNGYPRNYRYPNFYEIYSASRNKPFMVSETNAIFVYNATNPSILTPAGGNPSYAFPSSSFSREPPIPPVTPLDVKQAWWRQFMTNRTFLTSRPLMKMVCLFEFVVPGDQGTIEQGLWRDYTTSNDSTQVQAEVLESFGADLMAFGINVGSRVRGYRFASAGFSTQPFAWPRFPTAAILSSPTVPVGVPTGPPTTLGSNSATSPPDASRLILWSMLSLPVIISLAWGIGSFIWKRRMRKLQVAAYVRKDEEEEVPDNNGGEQPGGEGGIGANANEAPPVRRTLGRGPGIEDLDEEDQIVLDPFGFRRRQRIREILREREEMERGPDWGPGDGGNASAAAGGGIATASNDASSMNFTLSRIRDIGQWASWTLSRSQTSMTPTRPNSEDGMLNLRSATLPIPRRAPAPASPTDFSPFLRIPLPRRPSLPSIPNPPTSESPTFLIETARPPPIAISTVALDELTRSGETPTGVAGFSPSRTTPLTPGTANLPRVGNSRHATTPAERDRERRASRATGRVVNLGL
ncbi:hypothetical protein HDU67_000272 [Dinochytrium kinnereticum]|nr:hypothetical protein HDU67_000272 [Dinochytrium kinnereticum]